MSDIPTTPASPEPLDLLKLARAIRFAFAMLVLGLSYFAIRISLTLGNFKQIFYEMLGDADVPAFTGFVMDARVPLAVISMLVPVLVIASLFMQNLRRSFYLPGILGLLTLTQFVLLTYATFSPLQTIITKFNPSGD